MQFFASKTRDHYPDIYTDCDEFWVEQAALRDFIAGFPSHRQKYGLPPSQRLATTPT